MYSIFEDNLRDLDRTQKNLEEISEALDNIENKIINNKKDCPKINLNELAYKSEKTIVDILSSKSYEDSQNFYNDLNEYIKYEKKNNELKLEKQRLNAEYIDALTKREELSKIIDFQKSYEKRQTKRYNKNIKEVDRLLKKDRILTVDECVLLNTIMGKLEKASFLENEAEEYINDIKDRLDKNSDMLENVKVCVKPPKTKFKNILNVKNKNNSIIAKGKGGTLNIIKKGFEKAKGHIVEHIKEIKESWYNALCDLKKEELNDYNKYFGDVVSSEENLNEEDMKDENTKLDEKRVNVSINPKSDIDVIDAKIESEEHNLKFNDYYTNDERKQMITTIDQLRAKRDRLINESTSGKVMK